MAAVVSSKRAWRSTVGWLLALGAFCWAFPLFHVRSLSEPSQADAKAPLDMPSTAQQLWDRMRAGETKTVDANALLEVLERDPAGAEGQYGRRIGYGGPAFYFVHGEGRVIELTRKGVVLAIPGRSTKTMLVTGPVFGNALRDATGLANIGDFDSFQFNALSAELNLLAERRAQPRIAELAQPGTSLRFVGGAKYASRGGVTTLEIVATHVERSQ